MLENSLRGCLGRTCICKNAPPFTAHPNGVTAHLSRPLQALSGFRCQRQCTRWLGRLTASRDGLAVLRRHGVPAR